MQPNTQPATNMTMTARAKSSSCIKDNRMHFNYHTRHHKGSVELPQDVDATAVFDALSCALEIQVAQRIFVWSETGEFVIQYGDGKVFLPEGALLKPEEKLIVWIFDHPDKECQVLHLWRDDLVTLFGDRDVFPDGCAYDRFGPVIDDQNDFLPGINQLFTKSLEDRPKPANPKEAWKGPSVCGCDLLQADVECPTAWIKGRS